MRPSPSRRLSDEKHARLLLLAELASYRLDELLAGLGVRARRQGKAYVGPCPVHGGDKANAWNLYPDGHSVRGIWACRTRNCQRAFQRTIPGLVRGVLSHQRLGWTPEDGTDLSKTVPMTTVIDWLCKLVGRRWEDLKPDLALAEKRRFVTEMATLGYFPEVVAEGWDAKEVRSRLAIPSPYFVGRGWSPGVLDRYSVGDATTADPASPMFARAVVPVFDRDGRRVVGTSGRSVHGRCPDCRHWHAPGGCPANPSLPAFAKWRHTAGFDKRHHLYNWWAAREHVRRTGRLLLLESPGDVWRAEEAGCPVSAAMFGVVLNDPQQVLVEASGAMDVYVGTNLDAAGEQAAVDLVRQLRRAFRVHVLTPPRKDLGETPVEEVGRWLTLHGLLGR
jgi:hypothetical protein